MAIFIQEWEQDPIAGDLEMIKIDDLEMTVSDFRLMEPEHPLLPSGTKGERYVQGKEHYCYLWAGGSVVSPLYEAEYLNGLIAKVGVYVSGIAKNKADKVLQDWKTDSLSLDREKRISELKAEAKKQLAETDWYIIRNQENGEIIPQIVTDYRTAIRKAMDDAETSIALLTDSSEIMSAQAVWPVKL